MKKSFLCQRIRFKDYCIKRLLIRFYDICVRHMYREIFENSSLKKFFYSLGTLFELCAINVFYIYRANMDSYMQKATKTFHIRYTSFYCGINSNISNSFSTTTDTYSYSCFVDAKLWNIFCSI